MPTTARLRSYLARVEQQDFVGALTHFYHDDATMQENFGDVRQGRDRLVANEMEILLRYGSTRVRKVERYAVHGDIVFINWVIDLAVHGLGHRVLDEISMQVWDGDRIRSERFYYDPAQIRA